MVDTNVLIVSMRRKMQKILIEFFDKPEGYAIAKIDRCPFYDMGVCKAWTIGCGLPSMTPDTIPNDCPIRTGLLIKASLVDG